MAHFIYVSNIWWYYFKTFGVVHLMKEWRSIDSISRIAHISWKECITQLSQHRQLTGVRMAFLPASPKAKAGLGVQSPSVRRKVLSSQLLWNYWSNYHKTWYVDRTSYVVMHISRKCWSPHFCGSYAPWNVENTHTWPCHRNSSETIDPIFMKLGM